MVAPVVVPVRGVLRDAVQLDQREHDRALAPVPRQRLRRVLGDPAVGDGARQRDALGVGARSRANASSADGDVGVHSAPRCPGCPAFGSPEHPLAAAAHAAARDEQRAEAR